MTQLKLLNKWKQEGKIPQSWTSASCEDANESHNFGIDEVGFGGDKNVCKKCGYVEYG